MLKGTELDRDRARKEIACKMYLLVVYNKKNQRTNGPVNAHLISWPSKAQDIQNLENIW